MNHLGRSISLLVGLIAEWYGSAQLEEHRISYLILLLAAKVFPVSAMLDLRLPLARTQRPLFRTLCQLHQTPKALLVQAALSHWHFLLDCSQ